MNERVKELRKVLGLTLEKFGNALGVSRSAIADIESGKNNVTERMIVSICSTSWSGRYVSEDWIRTGQGKIFKSLTRNEKLMAFINQVMKDEPESFRRAFVEALSMLPPEGWKWLEKFCRETADRMEAGEAESTNSLPGDDLPLDVADQVQDLDQEPRVRNI